MDGNLKRRHRRVLMLGGVFVVVALVVELVRWVIGWIIYKKETACISTCCLFLF